MGAIAQNRESLAAGASGRIPSFRAQYAPKTNIRHRLSQRPAGKYRRPAQPITRDLELIFLYQQPAGFLTCRSTRMAAFPIPLESVTVHDKSHALLTYSDEIAQDFHLFPFYPHSAARTAAPAALYSICFISYHRMAENAIKDVDRGGSGAALLLQIIPRHAPSRLLPRQFHAQIGVGIIPRHPVLALDLQLVAVGGIA